MNEHQPPIAQDGAQPVFFPVSRPKLFIMSIATFGLYEAYWFYQNWRLVKRRTDRHFNPFWRTLVAWFFCYSLFKEVKESGRFQGRVTFSPGLLTVAWIGLSFCGLLPSPFDLVGLLSVLALFPIQKTVNDLNAVLAPNHNPNRRLSGWNIAIVVVGGLLFLLTLVGTFLPG
jgi:hypothetical protein